MEQMRRRLPGYAGHFPIWLWVTPKPDLRHAAHLPSGEPGVRIEFEIPTARILQLDFDTWHCVLNRWYLPTSESDEREWERNTKAVDRFAPVFAEPLESELRKSWERVFEFDLLRTHEHKGRVDRIQGVTEYVRLDEVVNVRTFLAR
jgi:hypothetical protein